MELKLENNLAHQTIPVEGVAAVVEASIQEPAKENHQNPLLQRNLDKNALYAARLNARIVQQADRQKVSHYMLTDKIKNLPVSQTARHQNGNGYRQDVRLYPHYL